MTQQALPLLPRTDHARPDEETGVQIAWALDGGRPVHIARYSHLRDGGARTELTCLGCSVPVVPVLPLVGKGRPSRKDHFRHKRVSEDCWAHHGLGAQLWNAVLHLRSALDEAAGTALAGRLRIRAACDPAAGRWTVALPLFGTGCPEVRRLPLPAWDTVRLTPTRRGATRVPEIRLLLGEAEQLRIRVVAADALAALRPLTDLVPTVEIHLDDRAYAQILDWRPSSDADLPCTRATAALSWRCPTHR